METAAIEFEKFKKIPRLYREIVVTEKIDGTNAQVYVPDDEAAPLLAGSRNRWITPGKGTDNYDFADWVDRNAEVLRRVLGPGRHYGEWWGAGIARKYGLTERRWSLFNTSRWGTWAGGAAARPEELAGLPDNVYVVPTLYRGPLDMAAIAECCERLKVLGSRAVPFLNPEGIVVHHLAAGVNFKFTLDGDAVKGLDRASPEE